MSFTSERCKMPRTKIPGCKCDKEIHTKLNKFPFTRDCLNLTCSCAFIGRQGSGKTTLLLSLLGSKDVYKKCFHCVFVVSPSLNSLEDKNNPLSKLPPERFFTSLDSLPDIYDMIKMNSENGLRTLLILDDVASELKGPYEQLLLKIIANQRHLYCTTFLVSQSYKLIPKPVRSLMSNICLFGISKVDVGFVFDEIASLLMDQHSFMQLIRDTFTKKHDWLWFRTGSNFCYRGFSERLVF